MSVKTYICTTCSTEFSPAYKRVGEPKYCSQQCYQSRPRKKKVVRFATCHPEKPYAADGLCSSCYSVRHRNTNRQAYRDASYKHVIKKKYGLSPEGYDALFSSQDGKCAACRGALTRIGDKGRRPHVDHDHTTGAVRGLLCHGCNIALGLTGDSPTTLRLLADYLDTHNAARREVA